MQSAAQLQSPNEASVEAFEGMDPAVETANPRTLLTTEDIQAADAVRVTSCRPHCIGTSAAVPLQGIRSCVMVDCSSTWWIDPVTVRV